MVLLSLHGLPSAQIAELLDCHPATVRRAVVLAGDETQAHGPASARTNYHRHDIHRSLFLLSAIKGQKSDGIVIITPLLKIRTRSPDDHGDQDAPNHQAP
jgi:hypothetical protein